MIGSWLLTLKINGKNTFKTKMGTVALYNSEFRIHSKYYNEHKMHSKTKDKYINLSSPVLFYLNADGGRPSCAREDDSPKSCRCFS